MFVEKHLPRVDWCERVCGNGVCPAFKFPVQNQENLHRIKKIGICLANTKNVAEGTPCGATDKQFAEALKLFAKR